MQKNEIIGNIQDLKQRFDQLFQNSLDQLTQQGGDEQLVHLPNEQIGEALGKKALTGISKVASLDFKENKTPSEYLRGVLKGDFGLKKWNGYAICLGVCVGVSILALIADGYMQSHVKDLAKQCEEEWKKTQNQLGELRRKTENYYRRFRLKKRKPSDRGFVLSFIGFLALLFALLFGFLALL